MAQKMVEDEETKKSGNTLFCWEKLLYGIIISRYRGENMHRNLIRIFVKDADNIEKDLVRNNYGSFTAIIGILSNTMLFGIKIVLGLIFSSISILADALNNLVDSISSIITLLGFKLATKPADKEHPFGHARYETISGLLVGIIVVYVGVEFIQASIKEIISPTAVKSSPIVLFILLLTVLIKLWQYRFNKFVGNKIQSNVILATAVDSRNDMLITILVLFGVFVEFLFKVKVDGYIGLLLAIIIIISGINAMKKTVDELLGQRPTNENLQAIEKQLKSYKNIIGFHDLIVHQYGHNQFFATVHVEVDAKLDLINAHDIIDEIEHDFLRKLRINLVVHLDPVILDDPIIEAYYQEMKKIIKSYEKNYSFHDFRLIKHYDHNIIIFDLVVDQNEERSDNEIIDDLSNDIKKVYPNDMVEIVVDRNYLSLRR